LARGKPKKSPTAETHTHLTINVDTYEASVSAGVNHVAYEPQYGWYSDGEEPVYQFRVDLTVSGKATSPADRARDSYDIMLSGEDTPVRNLDCKLSDLAELDEIGSPQYRTYRGRDVPIYEPPPGLGVLNKVRGAPSWSAFLLVKPSMIEQWLTLLTTHSDLFISLHECRANRTRWVRRIQLGTADPTEL
jgi:hypothetical protein